MGEARVLFVTWVVIASGAFGCGPEPAPPSASASAPAVTVPPTATAAAVSASAKREPLAEAPPKLPELFDGSLEDAPYATQVAEKKMSRPLFWCERQEWSDPREAYGHVMDDAGRVWFVNFGRARTAHPAGELHRASVLEARYRHAILQTRRVPREVLALLQQKAALAQKGSVSWNALPQNHLHPSITSCEAYLWEEDGRYRRVHLGQAGEISGHHSAPEANELWDWLHREVGMGWRAPR